MNVLLSFAYVVTNILFFHGIQNENNDNYFQLQLEFSSFKMEAKAHKSIMKIINSTHMLESSGSFIHNLPLIVTT